MAILKGFFFMVFSFSIYEVRFTSSLKDLNLKLELWIFFQFQLFPISFLNLFFRFLPRVNPRSDSINFKFSSFPYVMIHRQTSVIRHLTSDKFLFLTSDFPAHFFKKANPSLANPSWLLANGFQIQTAPAISFISGVKLLKATASNCIENRKCLICWFEKIYKSVFFNKGHKGNFVMEVWKLKSESWN